MSRASIRTLLSLDRFARILGINPVHFNGAVGSNIWPANGACKDIWPQYSWQTSDELIGREEVALSIATAEDDIKRVLGYSLAPQWEIEEDHAWTFDHYPTRRSTVQTGYGMVIAPGRRAVSLIDDSAAVVYSDPDGDGWDERATITVTTSVTDIREIKVYTAGKSGDPEWEIRTPRSITLSGGTATIVLDAWLMIDPDLWEEFPTATEWEGIDVTDSGNFVTTVDVYREYNDTTQASATFLTASGSCAVCGGLYCASCGEEHDGCFGVVDSRLGFVAAAPATYSDGAWRYSTTTICGPIRGLQLSYHAGLQDKQYIAGRSLEPLSHYYAEAIAWLAAARLPSDICDCNNVRERLKELQRDASMIREREGGPIYARFERTDINGNPFGSRAGEVKAWQRLVRLQGELGGAAVL